jgi:hypothetical protein
MKVGILSRGTAGWIPERLTVWCKLDNLFRLLKSGIEKVASKKLLGDKVLFQMRHLLHCTQKKSGYGEYLWACWSKRFKGKWRVRNGKEEGSEEWEVKRRSELRSKIEKWNEK